MTTRERPADTATAPASRILPFDTGSPAACALCGNLTDRALLAEATRWRFWERDDGACPACVQESLLQTLLRSGDDALHASIQSVWPLDAGAAFGALPTPLRLHADPRFRGRGITMALIDSGFFPHPDLVRPANRIAAWVDAGQEPVQATFYAQDEEPHWPGWDATAGAQWHGTMTSVAAAGNGWLSHGLYRGLASEANVVLIQARQPDGAITNASIARALAWLHRNGPALGVRVVNLSVAGDPVSDPANNPVDSGIGELVAAGVVVTAAAGNDGVRRLVPPASSPYSITVGGIDDANTFAHEEVRLWHSNYGESAAGAPKPELVAPSIWLAAPVLPGTAVAEEAAALFERRSAGDRSVDHRIDQLRLITPHYQHLDGTSFAAPVVASAVACMLEANRALTPDVVRDLLLRCATRVPGAPSERQGAGALEAGRSVAFALHESHTTLSDSPSFEEGGVRFRLHDHAAGRVTVFGSWDGWQSGFEASANGNGEWATAVCRLREGRFAYKFLIDETMWLDDPRNIMKVPDGVGGFNSVVVVTGPI